MQITIKVAGTLIVAWGFSAFVLWDAGYDVWLGNYRGTYPSEDHVNLTTRDPRFWETR